MVLNNIFKKFNKSYGDSEYHILLDGAVKQKALELLDEVFQLKRKRKILAIDCYGNIFFVLDDEKNILYGLSINKREDDFFIFRSFIFTNSPKNFNHHINPTDQEITQINSDEKIAGKRGKKEVIVKELNKWQSDTVKVYLQDICTFYEQILSESEFDRSRLDIYELEGDDEYFVEKTYENGGRVYEYENLKIMILRYAYFSKKIENIKNLLSLRLLEIDDGNFLSTLVKLPYLVNLELNFIKNAICTFSHLQKLKHLKYLHISNCKNIDLKDIASFNKLKSLHVGQTRVKNLAQFSKDSLCELSMVDCKNVNFKDICGLRSIEKLHITSCEITSLEGIEKLTNLKELNLSNNRIKSVLKEIVKLSNLYSLNLQNNYLETLPKGIDKLPLKSLKLKNNSFKSLPTCLNNLPKEVIDLEFKNIALYDKKAKELLEHTQKGECMFENDINLKLMIIQKLMYDDEILLPKFDIYDFAKENGLDLDKIGYEIIPQALKYFENLPISKLLLLEISELDFDGSNEIYSQLIPHSQPNWDDFIVKDIKDIKYLQNLRSLNSENFTKEQVVSLEKMGIKVVL